MLDQKRGQIESLIVVIITIFIIGVFFFFSNHVTDKLYGSFDEYFNNSAEYNNSEAHQAIREIQDVENSVYDYAFLAIFIGFIIQMVIFSFATRISIAFYWIFAIVGIVVLIIATVLSTIWQEVAASPEFALTITRFPITNLLLGSYFPTAVTGILLIVIIVVFGKPQEGLAN